MLKGAFFLFALLSVLSILYFPGATLGQNTENVSFNNLTTPEPAANKSCEVHNNDCKGCVANTECYYCSADNKCHDHITTILTDDKCPVKDMNYLTCRLNFEYLLIVLGSLAGIALLIILVFCCVCCCKKKGVKISKDDLKWARQREERKQIAEERKKERAERTEQIRRKYGLVKDSNPYQKFDA